MIEIGQIKDLIDSVSQLPLEEHCNRFDEVHTQLQAALSEVDGI
jgi:hypothetical protein